MSWELDVLMRVVLWGLVINDRFFLQTIAWLREDLTYANLNVERKWTRVNNADTDNGCQPAAQKDSFTERHQNR